MYAANLLATLGIVAEATVIAVLVWRRVYRSLPVFFFYIVWGLIGDSAILILRTVFHSWNMYPYEIEIYVDLVFQYLVLIELAWSTLRPIRRSLPRGFLLGISLVIAAAAVLAWLLSAIKETAGFPAQLLLALHAQRAFALVRILFFLVLACFSHFLRIGWHDRELQVATGLGFYSLISLAGTMVQSHQFYGQQYYYVEIAIACSYVLSLGYWTYSFGQKEAARRDMTPEMQSFLLGMASVLRHQRNTLSAPEQ